MANYFSLGVESRIGIGFDRRRTDNTTMNKVAYMWEGIKKLVFHRARFVNKLITRVEYRNPSSDYWTVLCDTKRTAANAEIPMLTRKHTRVQTTILTL